MIAYFHPDLGDPKDENKKKRFVNELMNPDQAYLDAVQKASLKKPKSDIQERKDDKLLTNDGREIINEQ